MGIEFRKAGLAGVVEDEDGADHGVLCGGVDKGAGVDELTVWALFECECMFVLSKGKREKT